MRKVIVSLIFVACCLPCFAQGGYNLETFSQGTPTAAVSACSGSTCTNGPLGISWYGSRGLNINTIFATNAGGTLTYQSTSLCNSGAYPPGVPSSEKLLDWAITTTSAAYVAWNLPPSNGGTTSTVSVYKVWFCSNLPSTGSQQIDECDCFVVIGSGSQLSNFVCNAGAMGSGQCGFTLEGEGGTYIKYVPGTWVQLVGQYVTNGGCADHTNFTDCVRLHLYDSSGNLITACYGTAPCSGGVLPGGDVYEATGGANAPQTSELGQINAGFTTPSADNGFHFQWSHFEQFYENATTANFGPMYPAPAWDGIITPGRGIDWTQAGIPGSNAGTLPSSSWSQYGATITSFSAASTVNSAMSGCSNQYVLIGAGTFTFTGQIKVPANCELRGSGANSTFLVTSGSASACAEGFASAICILSGDTTNNTGNGYTDTYTVSAGLAQGSTKLTLSSVAGITTSTMLALYQNNTGYAGPGSGVGCAIDNAQLFVATDQYQTSGCNNPNGDSSDGGGSGPGPGVEHDQMEIHAVTNVSGSVVTITPPVSMPNWAPGTCTSSPAVGLCPVVGVFTPITTAGLQNISIDVTSYGSTTSGCVGTGSGYQIWVSGITCKNWHFAGINLYQTSNFIVQNSYFFNSPATGPDMGYGVRPSVSAYGLIANNITQQVGQPFFEDGLSVGNVYEANFCINDSAGNSSFMNNCFDEHATNYFVLFEENIGNQIQSDNVHGTSGFLAGYRNLLLGWESFPSVPKTSDTNALGIYPYARYFDNIASVLGTPTYSTPYSSTTSASAVYWPGGSGGTGVPTDSHVNTTLLKWASWDSVTGGARFCGNSLDTGWSTTCASASEVPDSSANRSGGLTIYPNFVPVYGDTAIGEGPLPASFFYTSRPSWWASSIPFPAIGPDVSGGNIGACSTSTSAVAGINTVGQYNGVPATSATQCAGQHLYANAWGGTVNAIPAMICALNVMGMPPDGSGSALIFNPSVCYSASSISPAPFPTILAGRINQSGQVTLP